MIRILEEFFSGNIIPCEIKTEKTKEHTEVINASNETEMKLLFALEGEDRELFVSYLDLRGEIEGKEFMEYFIAGFKLGAKFQIAMSEDDDSYS